MAKKKRTNKKKKGLIIGCVALSALLAISTYITVVVIGVVAEENKKGTLIGTPDVTEGTTQNVNNPALDNGYIQYENQNPGTVVPGVNQIQNSETLPNNNNAQQNNDAPVQRPVNTLLNENKTKADIVKIYADVMGNAKAKAPGFTKIEYQELPDGEENRVFSEGGDKAGDEAVAKMLNFVQTMGVFIPKEEAEANPYIHEKGDADMARFPVFDREKGSYLTDPNSIESYTYTVLPNGNVKMHFVLVSEDNPEPISENSNTAPSYTGAVFSPMSKAKIDGTVYHPIVTVFAKDIKYSLRYHDCSVEVEFNPNTLEIVHLEQIARVSIKGSGNVVGLGKIGLERQELIGTVICKDFSY
jgi:hypothetical protein